MDNGEPQVASQASRKRAGTVDRIQVASSFPLKLVSRAAPNSRITRSIASRITRGLPVALPAAGRRAPCAAGSLGRASARVPARLDRLEGPVNHARGEWRAAFARASAPGATARTRCRLPSR
jgi:hypothetical protein